MKRNKTPDYKDRTVFGVPLLYNLQRTGHPLPQTILYAMRYLRRTSHDAVGIFRKPGVRSRIQQLKKMNEANPGMSIEDEKNNQQQKFIRPVEFLFSLAMLIVFINFEIVEYLFQK